MVERPREPGNRHGAPGMYMWTPRPNDRYRCNLVNIYPVVGFAAQLTGNSGHTTCLSAIVEKTEEGKNLESGLDRGIARK